MSDNQDANVIGEALDDLASWLAEYGCMQTDLDRLAAARVSLASLVSQTETRKGWLQKMILQNQDLVERRTR